VNPEAAAKQLAGPARELGAAYALIAGLLARLPVPMNLPSQAEDPSLATRSLSLAWELAAEETVPAVTVARIRDMITAWLAAYELAVIAIMYGPAPWRLRGIEDAVLRIRAAAADVERHLAGDYRGQEVTDAERAEMAALKRRRKRRR
jgi:hypothetical protein